MQLSADASLCLARPLHGYGSLQYLTLAEASTVRYSTRSSNKIRELELDLLEIWRDTHYGTLAMATDADVLNYLSVIR